MLDDADIGQAVEDGVKSRLLVSGQVCIAAKRFIVTDTNRVEFEEALTRRMAAARMGDPLDEEVDFGPLARPDLRDNVARQVFESVIDSIKNPYKKDRK